jgi:hypothetical protein
MRRRQDEIVLGAPMGAPSASGVTLKVAGCTLWLLMHLEQRNHLENDSFQLGIR